MTSAPLRTALRLILGALTLVAITLQLGIHVRLGYNPVNFFSYFTNLANIFAAGVFLFCAFSQAIASATFPRQDLLRGVSVAQMTVVGIVFHTLLRNVDLGSLLPWINFLLHTVMPVAVLADWILEPPQTRITFRQMLLWLAFPLLYLTYTLIRGAIIAWCPYPFLNPGKMGGYVVVSAYCIEIAVFVLLTSWVLMRLGNRTFRKIA